MLVCVRACIYSLSLSFFFFKQKTAYEMRISDWSSDVCSSDLPGAFHLSRTGSPAQLRHKLRALRLAGRSQRMPFGEQSTRRVSDDLAPIGVVAVHDETLGFANCTKPQRFITDEFILREAIMHLYDVDGLRSDPRGVERSLRSSARSEEHTYEL